MRPYPFKRAPYDHQKQALKKALRIKNCALLLEPRCGKTKVSIDYLSALALAGKIDRAVIVVPSRVIDVWIQAFQDDCPVSYHIHVWDADARSRSVTTTKTTPGKVALERKNGVTYQVETFQKKQTETKRVAIPIPKASSAYQLNIVIVNYDAFSTSGPTLPSGHKSTTSGRYKNRALIEKWLEGKPAACILDESHKIKAPQGKAAKMIVSMRGYFAYKLILTGTPVTKAKRVFDIHMQWKFLNPNRFADLPTHTDFRDHYGVWRMADSGTHMEFKRNKNLEELTERIHQDAVVIKRADCFDLPPKTTVVRKVSLGEKSGNAYDELAKEMVARIEHEDRTHLIEASIPLVLTLRLTQITGGFGSTAEERDADGELIKESKIIPLGREKLNVLEGLIEEAIENDEKMVVAARFKAEMDAITRLVRSKKVPAYEVRGGLKRAETTANIKDFTEHDGCAVIVMNPQAGGVGIDLSTATHMVWYSLTHSWVDYTQSCDRIALSKLPTTYTYLLAEGTTDELLYATLQEDGDIAETILSNPRKVLRS